MPDWTEADITYFEDEEPGIQPRLPQQSGDFATGPRGGRPGEPEMIPIPEGGTAWDAFPDEFNEHAFRMADEYANEMQTTDKGAAKKEFLDSIAATKLREMGGGIGTFGITNRVIGNRMATANMAGMRVPGVQRTPAAESKGIGAHGANTEFRRGQKNRIAGDPTGAGIGPGMSLSVAGKKAEVDEYGHVKGYWNGKLDRS